MAFSYVLGPVPKWYFADNFGRPLGAGKMYTYSNINKVQYKPVFQDQGGFFPWTQPVLFDENGMQGPFYWQVNSLDPLDTYYLEIFDKDDVLQFTVENYIPPGTGGGGGSNNFISIKNLVPNNIFLNNIGESVSPINSTDFVIAPGAHMGLNPSMVNIRFIKQNTNQTDQLQFLNFNFGTSPFTGDVTPVQYVNYACTVAAAEDFKYIQIPITSKVDGLDHVDVTFSLWARQTLGVLNNLQASIVQYYGTDGTNPPVFVETSTTLFPLTADWTKYFDTISIPITSSPVAACGDDGIFLRIKYPTNTVATIDFALPRLYLGAINPNEDFDTNDQVVSVIDTARTGDVRISVNNFGGYGWVEMNDGTIGNESSGATARANIDTFPLFKTIWDQVGSTYAPIFTSTGTPSTYGGSPEEDFVANKRLSLTKALGRALSGFGSATGATNPVTNWALGQFFGEESVSLTVGQLAAHNHPGSTGFWHLNAIPVQVGVPGSPLVPAYSGAVTPVGDTPVTVNVANQGNDQAHPNIQPTVHYRIFMKL